ncbi:molybdopterin cofactor-binding domain-containing protein [Nocardioides sp. NPDC057577]|uniref:molybdopterin cofactor-binding domain-containing protein n=1 Tax=Nocardioides sp. NPDC057577 TaxID=3346171 RepID=UPI00366E1B15
MSTHPETSSGLSVSGLAEHELGRRRFVGYLLAAATVTGAAQLGIGLGTPAAAVVPGVPQPADLYDLNDLLTDAARPTANLIQVVVDKDGTASFELPRAEVGQGITTSIAMLIAEELDLPLSKVNVTLSKARPELIWNQMTGGSNTIHAMYTPVRVAAAIARGALLDAAAIALAQPHDTLSVYEGVITAPGGASISYGELATSAAALVTKVVDVDLKPKSDFSVIGTPRRRKDALDAVTGTKQFAMDLDVPGALPAMVCRAPEHNGTVRSVRNQKDVEAMPGVTHVVTIPTGVAVRAKTFGQCINAVRALDVEWNPGSVSGKSDADVLEQLRGIERPMLVPDVDELLGTVTDAVGGLTGGLGAADVKTLDTDFVFYTRSGSPLETNCAVADVRADKATIWAGSKTPIVAAESIALELGLPPTAVTFNVVESGGSFGRKLFWDAAQEAALISQKCQAPVRLMWHRADEPRQGRNHPMATSRVRTVWAGDNILAVEQQHTCTATDYRHGFGEILTSSAISLPAGVSNLGVSETIFVTSQQVPYDFGVTTQGLMETTSKAINSGAVRNVYSPDVRTALELTIDQVAKKMRLSPVAFRLKYAKEDRLRRVIKQVAAAGSWGRSMPAGTAQGIAVHQEYKGYSACLVEIDCRPETVNRKVYHGVTGPRVTKVTFAIDCGEVINPKGVEAQMQGGIMDGIALALTASTHLEDGHYLEASWDNYFYTRQWNTPPDVRVFVMDPVTDIPGGAGEAGVAASFAAVACAYARATGSMPTSFPINHHDPIGFEVKSFVPPVPASPTDGLSHTY